MLTSRSTLAEKQGFGAVLSRTGGEIEISILQQTISVGEPQYWMLMEMLSEAAVRLAGKVAGDKEKYR